jgi:hypothetical protein
MYISGAAKASFRSPPQLQKNLWILTGLSLFSQAIYQGIAGNDAPLTILMGLKLIVIQIDLRVRRPQPVAKMAIGSDDNSETIFARIIGQLSL